MKRAFSSSSEKTTTHHLGTGPGSQNQFDCRREQSRPTQIQEHNLPHRWICTYKVRIRLTHMGFLDSAETILKRAKKPMHRDEITQIALKEKLLETSGKTPNETMGARIYMDIIRKGRNSKFIKIDRGLFGLRSIRYDYESKNRPEIKERKTGGVVTEYSDLMSADYLDDIINYLANKSGIYALYGDDEKLWYVGLATNLKTRLLQHKSDRHQKKWTKFRIFVVPNNRLDAVETILIQVARPKGNRTKGNIRGAKNITNEIRRDFSEKIKKYGRF